jgi:sulfur carrier protein
MIRVNGDQRTHEPDMTVADMLQSCNYTFRLIAVWIDGALVSRKAYATTLVPDGSDVRVIHMIAGG